MHRFLVTSIKILAALALFVPLVFVPNSFIFPYIFPKVIVFRLLVELMSGAYILLLVTEWQTYRPRLTPLTIALVFFFVSLILSTVAGVDWQQSLWDSDERMMGVVTLAHYGVFFIIMTAVWWEKFAWRWVLHVALGVGAATMAIALIQWFFPQFLFNHGAVRTISTLGNPIFVGGYGAFLFWLGLLMFVQESRWVWRIYALIAGLLGVSGIFTSATRGAIVGLVAGLCISWVLIVTLMKHQPRTRLLLACLAGVAVCIVACLFFFRTTTFVQRIPAINTLVNLDLHGGTSETRFMAWGTAVDAWKDRPFLGWGPANFLYAFNAHYRPAMLEHGWGETWFDNAHNIFFNTLATQGLVGILAYASIFCAAAVCIVRGYREGRLLLSEVSILSALLVTHVVHNFFVFEQPTSSLYFFLILAYVETVGRSKGETVTPTSSLDRRVPTVLFGAVALGVFVLVYAVNINPARANRTLYMAMEQVYALEDPTVLYEAALRISTPHRSAMRSEFSRLVVSAVKPYAEKGKAVLAKRLTEIAFSALGDNVHEHPRDIRYALQQAETALTGATLFGRIDWVATVEPALKKALVYSPKRQQALYDLAWVESALGKNAEAVSYMQQAVADDPVLGENWWRLALMYKTQGDMLKAQDVVREAAARHIFFDAQALNVIRTILPEAVPTTTGAL